MLVRVDLDGFVRRLGLAERALLESRLRAADGLRQGHLFMDERLPMCRSGALPVGKASPAVAQALYDLHAGRLRVFRLAHASLQSGEAACLDGGHVRAALVATVRDCEAGSQHAVAKPSLWAGISFGPLRVIQGKWSTQIALAGRLASTATQPLVMVAREDWLQVHCPSGEVVMATDLSRSRTPHHALPTDEVWRAQCETGRKLAGELARQVRGLHRMAAMNPQGEAARFVQRANAALQSLDAQQTALVRIGMGGGLHPGLRQSYGMHRPSTVPTAVLAHKGEQGGSPVTDAVPLGWMLLEPVWR